MSKQVRNFVAAIVLFMWPHGILSKIKPCACLLASRVHMRSGLLDCIYFCNFGSSSFGAAPTELLASSALQPARAVLHQLNRIPYLNLFDFSYLYALKFLESDRWRKSEIVEKKE